MSRILTLNDNDANIARLPLMGLREVVMFPRSIIPLFVGRDASIKAIEHSITDFDKKILLVTQREAELEKPGLNDLFGIGTVSKILQLLRLPDGTIKVLFEGLYRSEWAYDQPVNEALEYQIVTASRIPETDVRSAESEALVRTVHESLDEYAKASKKIAQETLVAASSLNMPGRLADAVIPHLKVDYRKKQAILEIIDPLERLTEVYALLQGELEISTLEKKIKTRVKNQMENNQREYYLNEQIKAINKEMGREEDPQGEIKALEEQLAQKDMPEENRAKVLKEIHKLRHIQPSSAEYTVVRNYVDWILDLPWNTLQAIDIDIDKARQILEDDHYGLEKPKTRILEYLAVQKLSDSLKGPILCFVGPPGVGKTSLAKSVARATGREFVRLSLGGVRDEAEIRGHRRTYVGALPGKIIQSLRRVKHNNPLFCLDEIDKMSMDFRGDPSAAMLEVLDPEQNYAFSDHYLDMDYDLSKIFFITTANNLHAIPLPLRDRMEIITLPGYLETEKSKIARNFLLPKQIKENGLTEKNMELTDAAILDLIRHYTREAGVRNLEREIGSLCRKTAMKLVETGDLGQTIKIDEPDVSEYLGVHKHRHGGKEDEPRVGVATGLAWTELGGELLVVESAIMPGTGKLQITGKLGEVMQESAKAALSYIRSRSDLFGLKPDFHKDIDIHIHVPEGATPKDGPSAGITLTTSLVSALLNVPVRNDTAMTGEITLRGRILPIGGLREKLLAAHRGLISQVLIPKDNAKDLKEVPREILDDLNVVTIDNMDDVLRHSLLCSDLRTIFSGQDEEIIPLSRSLLKGKNEVECLAKQ